MRQAGIRALRTFVQTFLGVYLAGLVGTPVLADLGNLDLLNSAAAAGVVAVLSFAQNLVEEMGTVSYDRG